MSRSLDLDVDSPEKVARILRNAAESYYESASELESAWQDRGAGRPWEKRSACSSTHRPALAASAFS